MDIFYVVLIIAAFVGIAFLLAMLIIDILTECINSTRSEATVVILNRYKALPKNRLTEPVKSIKKTLLALDDYYGIRQVNGWHWALTYTNTLSKKFEPTVRVGEDPVEYMQIYDQIIAIEKAIEEERKVEKPKVFGLVKSLEIDAEQIGRRSR